MRTVFSKIYRSVPSNLRLRCRCPYPYLKLFVSLWHSSLGGERFGGVLKSPAVEGKVDKSFTESVPTLYRRPPFGKGSAMHRSVVYWACAQRSGRNHFRDVLRSIPCHSYFRGPGPAPGSTVQVHVARFRLLRLHSSNTSGAAIYTLTQAYDLCMQLVSIYYSMFNACK